jgi:hypothetical protein
MMVRDAFTAHLLWAAALKDGMDQPVTMPICVCTRV